MSKKLILNAFLILSLTITYSQDDFSDVVSEGQVITITGKITDSSTGKAIAGANVVVDGSDLVVLQMKRVNTQLMVLSQVQV